MSGSRICSSRNFSASRVDWSTTVQWFTKYTNRRGTRTPAGAVVSSHTAITIVLPRPVGSVADCGKYFATNFRSSATCHGNGLFPVSASKASAHSESVVATRLGYTTSTTSFASAASVGRPIASIPFTHRGHSGTKST